MLDIFYWKKNSSYFFVGHSELDVFCWTNCHKLFSVGKLEMQPVGHLDTAGRLYSVGKSWLSCIGLDTYSNMFSLGHKFIKAAPCLT